MKHLGDITQIDWFTVEPVDVVTGGSPCQDLSVAGKRAGLAGERSGLYMEQIRCVKELREADVRRGRTGQFIRPRYMVWENVPGAFSSGKPKGSDFAAVIEEIIKVAEQDAYVCVLPPSGGWTKSGCYYDRDGRWSIAWRVHDAQFWGVPQRRKRISLVADFGGLSAPEILFERKGLRGNFEESGTPRKAAAAHAEGSSGADDRAGEICDVIPINTMIATRHKQLGRGTGFGVAEVGEPQFTISAGHEHAVAYTLKIRSGCEGGGKGALVQEGKSATIAANNDQYLFQPVVFRKGTHPHSKDEAQKWKEADVANTLNSFDQGEARANELVAEPIPIHDQATRFSGKRGDKSDGKGNGLGVGKAGDPMNTLTAGDRHAVAYSVGNGQLNQISMSETCNTLDCMHDKQAILEVQGMDCRNGKLNGDLCGTLQAKPDGGFSYNCIHPVIAKTPVKYIVRRHTPLEGERLQGYPDGWTDIGDWVDSKGKKRKAADGPRYKALGNSIALPFWCWLAKRISAQYERDITMGSLFDGIGGFPYAFEKCGGKALWASEIEEFPMAVTKIRFPEENAND